jgi:acetyl-CoA carboxylase carboxyl transferase subunit beta
MSETLRSFKLKRFTVQINKPKAEDSKKSIIPDGLFLECEGCHKALFHRNLEENFMVCPQCNFHFRMPIPDRLSLITEPDSFKEKFTTLHSVNPLNMPDYDKKLTTSQKVTNRTEAFIAGTALIQHHKVALGLLDSFFMMGSMGSVVGEKITRLIELSIKEKLPLVIFSASGGARMQEGIFSLMQMAKTSAALKRHHAAKLLFISVFTHPTTGGVTASFASLGDIHVAEQGALIGFAGARVIKQTIQQDLPEGFQTAQFQLQHGQIDLVVHRHQLKQSLAHLLALHAPRKTI